MTLTLRLAWRNLWRHARRTWLTTLAMVFSNVLLVFMIALQLGSYDLMINNTLQAFSGHVQVQHVGYNDNPRIRDSVPDVRGLAEALRGAFPDASVAARGMAFALLSSEERSYGAQLVGVEPDHEPAVSTLPGLLAGGDWFSADDAAEIVLGAVLARNLKVDVGDEVTLIGSGRDGSFAAGVVTVRGIYASSIPELERSMAELPLGYFQETFSMRGHGHAVVLAAPSLEEAGTLHRGVSRRLAGREDLDVLDWDRLQPGLKQAIRADLSSAWFMYGLLVILVAFSVLNTQLMSVLERTREFGVVLALGVPPGRLSRLVVIETTLMALLGFGIGVALGALVATWFHFNGFTYPGMEEMGARFNLPSKIYPSLSPLTLTLGPAVVFAGSVLAAIYPSLRLYRLRPVEAMRAV